MTYMTVRSITCMLISMSPSFGGVGSSICRAKPSPKTTLASRSAARKLPDWPGEDRRKTRSKPPAPKDGPVRVGLGWVGLVCPLGGCGLGAYSETIKRLRTQLFNYLFHS